MTATRQGDHTVRFDWGPTGGLAVGEGADVAVVVDVLSFTTALGVAVERGAVVVPYPAGRPDAAAVAAQTGAVLAGGRSSAAPDEPTLSPARLLEVARPVARGRPGRRRLPARAGAGVVAPARVRERSRAGGGGLGGRRRRRRAGGVEQRRPRAQRPWIRPSAIKSKRTWTLFLTFVHKASARCRDFRCGRDNLRLWQKRPWKSSTPT